MNLSATLGAQLLSNRTATEAITVKESEGARVASISLPAWNTEQGEVQLPAAEGETDGEGEKERGSSHRQGEVGFGLGRFREGPLMFFSRLEATSQTGVEGVQVVSREGVQQEFLKPVGFYSRFQRK